jgi:group II intron reverse transcriptase/maturase
MGFPKEGNTDGGTMDLLERILSRRNMLDAAKRVLSNKGAPGVDGMTVEDLLPYLEKHGDELIGRIRIGRYSPRPVRRVEIPKPDGGTRQLGIPTVIDRMVQQAIAQVLVPVFEQTFSEFSYGFRPERSAHDAMSQAYAYYDGGYTVAVDIDIAKYFDTVNHEKLIRMLREEVKDERVISLIRKYLRGGVLVGGLWSPTEEGVPQGSLC